jgi:signal recognition particle GTPase
LKTNELNLIINKKTIKNEELNKILIETQNALISANEQIKKEKNLINKMKEDYNVNLEY